MVWVRLGSSRRFELRAVSGVAILREALADRPRGADFPRRVPRTRVRIQSAVQWVEAAKEPLLRRKTFSSAAAFTTAMRAH